MKKLLSSFLAITLSLLVVGKVLAVDSTLTVTGDTSAGYNMAGWLFNRDPANVTPYEFTSDTSSVGSGSLYIKPIGSNAPDKFIGENFINTPITNVNTLKYDFKIGSGAELADASHFYMNVYANFGASDDLKFYDCRYDVVPTVGSKDGFTTVTFDPTVAYPVTQSGTATIACPAIPADMEGLSAGANIRAFALNVGDTSANDEGVEGYLDNVVTDLDSDKTIYDFEAAVVRAGEITAPTEGQEVSGSVNFEAKLSDDDIDPVLWAVRKGACDATTETVFGNVDGHTDVATEVTTDLLNQTLSFTGDMSTQDPGAYCFVYNPTEDVGETDIRLATNFTLTATELDQDGDGVADDADNCIAVANPGQEDTDNDGVGDACEEDEEEDGTPSSKLDCKNDGWMSLNTKDGVEFKNQGQCVSYVNHTDGKGSDDEHASQVKADDDSDEEEEEEVEEDEDDDDLEAGLTLSSSIEVKSKKNR